MLKSIRYKLMSALALAGTITSGAASAHSGIDEESGLLSVAVHEWLHTAWGTPLVLLGTVAAIAALLIITEPRRKASRGDPR